MGLLHRVATERAFVRAERGGIACQMGSRGVMWSEMEGKGGSVRISRRPAPTAAPTT